MRIPVWVSAIAAVVALVAALLAAIYALSTYECKALWGRSFITDYGFASGCQINVNGKWIPSSSYREVP